MPVRTPRRARYAPGSSSTAPSTGPRWWTLDAGRAPRVPVRPAARISCRPSRPEGRL